MNFSLYHNGIKNTIPNEEINMEKFLELIKEDNILIEKIRVCDNKEERDKLKSKLSYVTFAGTFENRANNKLKESSRLACFDYDDIEDLEKVKKEIIKSQFTHSLFVSPSGKGLKLIVKIPKVKDNEEYRKYWVSISEHFKGVKVDLGTKDISRACYLSVDKNPYFNFNSEVYTHKTESENWVKEEWKKHKASKGLIKIKFIKDTEKFKKGEIAESSKKSAESAVSQGYAEYVEEPKTEEETDTSRSAKEMSAIISLIKKELPREKVYEEMNVFAKWSEGSEGYKNKTYNKAFTWVEEKNKDKSKKKEDKEKKKFINRYVDEENKIIIEQVYNRKENKSQLCIYNFNTDEVRYVDYWEANGLKYFPKEGEELQKGAVLLPSKAEEYNDEELDKEIRNHITSWLDVPEEVTKFGIWNTKRSWVYDKFHSLNYLRALGDTGLGKSRYLNTFGAIHYTPIFTTGATTPAPLFRIIDKWRGTLVMDEADLKRSDESEDTIKIINLGFEKNNFIMRCDQNDASKIDFFDPYCPKILATRRSFQDKATESRCITHVMGITKIKDIPVNLNKEFYNSAEKLRNKLLMWRFKNYFKIDLNKKYEIPGIEPRVQQIVSSYISLFGDNEKQMKSFVEYIQNYQSDLIEERQSSFEGLIIGVIHKLLQKEIVDFTSKDIIEEGGFTTGKNDKPMQPRALNSFLKSLGFEKTIPKKVEGKTKRCIPLDMKMLENLFERYGYEVTEVTMDTEISQNNKREEKGQKKIGEVFSSAIRNSRNLRNSVTQEKQGKINVEVQKI
jgi:hypothetical protein|tara:strand:- start:2363 stop:4723 length:2361 start_codon:yes stop_codon:yes gene_type:complete